MAENGRRAYQGVSGKIADAPAPIVVTVPQAVPAPRAIPAGGTEEIRMIEGVEGVVHSNRAVAQEIARLAGEVKILNDRRMTMYGQQASVTSPGLPTDQAALVTAFKKAIDDGVATLQKTLPTGTTVAPAVPPVAPPAGAQTAPAASGGGVPPSAHPPAPPAAPQDPSRTQIGADWLPVPSPAVSGRQMAPGTTAPVPDSTAEIAEASGVSDPTQGSAPSPYDQYVHTRDYFGGKGKFTLANLRRDLGTSITQRLDNATWGEQLQQDPTGGWHHAPTDGSDFGTQATESEIASFLRREKMMGAVRGAAGTMAEGGTMGQAGMGMLGSAGAKALGVAGAAALGVKKATDFAEQQRAANNEWVSMTGGTQSDAYEQRFKGQVFSLGNMGVLSGEQSDELFKGVARAGLSGDQAGNAQDFALQNYKSLGMSIAESLDIITYAAQHGQETLGGLGEALDRVTESAKEAGVNTETARQSFVANWKTLSETFEGPQAVAMASGLSQAQAGLGKEFQNIDTSNMASSDSLLMAAASTGIDYNQLLATSMEPGGGADVLGMVQDTANQRYVEQFGGQNSPAMKEIAKAYQNRANQEGGLSEAELSKLQEDLLSHPEWGLPPAYALPQIIQSMGGPANLEPGNAMKFMIKSLGGEFDPAAAAQANEPEVNPVTQIDDWNYGRNRGGDYTANRETFNAGMEGVDINQGLGQIYQADANATGRVGGISQTLAAEGESTGIDKVTVQTEEGDRVVSLEDAMKYFRDQIDAGTATVAEGDYAGSTLAEVTQSEGDSSVDVTSDENSDLTGKGESAEEFQKSEAGGGGPTKGGTVTVTPSPYLLRLMTFTGAGNVEIDPSSFREPPTPDVGADSRPSGSAY